MIKLNGSYAYEKWCGSASDGGKEMFGQVHRPSTKVAVGPFDDERFIVLSDPYRNLDVSRWDFLTSVGTKLRAVEEKQEDGSIVYQLYAGDDDADSDEIARKATAELLHSYSLERLTKWGVDEFKWLVTKARQEFQLIEILSQPDFLKPDSSLESVIERLPAYLTASIDHDDVKDFVEGYIQILKDWEEIALYYAYKSFLAECGWITSTTSLEMLKEHATFSERKFGQILSCEMECGFRSYIAYLRMHEAKGTAEEGKADYIKRVSESSKAVRLSFEKGRKRFPPQFSEPIHFLVFREREKQYTIQDPVVEVAKIRAFFKDPLICVDSVQAA